MERKKLRLLIYRFLFPDSSEKKEATPKIGAPLNLIMKDKI